MAKPMNLRTQKDLLAYVLEQRACGEACSYIRRFPERTPAHEIWLACRHHEWLFWLGSRWNPETALAYCAKCIKRIESEHANTIPNADQRHYIGIAGLYYERAKDTLDRVRRDDCFYKNTSWAMYESLRAAKEYTAEADVRLKELLAMW